MKVNEIKNWLIQHGFEKTGSYYKREDLTISFMVSCIIIDVEGLRVVCDYSDLEIDVAGLSSRDGSLRIND